MKRDLITKHPLLPESKHMLYCTYAPHLLYSQAHIILLHTQLHLLHCDTHLSSPQTLTDWALEAEDSRYTAPMCFGHWALEAHTCPAATARLAALDPHTHLQKRRKDRNGLFVPSLWPVPKRRRIGYSCQTANVKTVFGGLFSFAFCAKCPVLGPCHGAAAQSHAVLWDTRALLPTHSLASRGYITCLHTHDLFTVLMAAAYTVCSDTRSVQRPEL